MGATFYFDEYNPDLGLDHLVIGGVGVRDGNHAERAATRFAELAGLDARFGKKARKWDGDQFEPFATYLLAQELIPIAWYVKLDDGLREAVSAHAKAAGPAGPASGFRKGQWLIAQVLMQALITGCVHWVLNLGRLDRLGVVMDDGNFKDWQKDAIANVVSEFTGEECFNEIRQSRDMRRLGIITDDALPSLQSSCAWPSPNLDFKERHPLLRVADGYTGFVSRFLQGDESAKKAMDLLDGSYAHRHKTLNASFLYGDGTAFVRGFLDG